MEAPPGRSPIWRKQTDVEQGTAEKPGNRFLDLTGQRFGRLVVVERAPNQGIRTRWRCKCDCGSVRVIASGSLRSGKTQSCGCRRRLDEAALPALACERPTQNHPGGRTGTRQGYGAHKERRQPACDACLTAWRAHSRDQRAALSPERIAQLRESNRLATQRRRIQDPERVKANSKTYRLANRAIIRAAKAVPCADCGISYPYYVMQFDHIGDKSFNVGSIGPTASRKRLLEEIAKCEVVCSNCHAERSFQRLKVPGGLAA